MIIENNVLTADEGHVLTNGEIYATQIYLGIYDNLNNWQEISENEIPEIIEEPQEEENLEELAAAARILLDI